MKNFGSLAGELLFGTERIGILLKYFLNPATLCCSTSLASHSCTVFLYAPIFVQVSDPSTSLRINSTMLNIVEKAGIKIYNTLISQLKSVIPVPQLSSSIHQN
jgi:hypothetical protein